MQYRWYYLTWDGIINPLVLGAALIIIGALWGARILSSRVFLGLVYATVLAWVVHLDNLMFVVGSDTLPPLDGWSPLPVRLLVYAVAWAFVLWGTWGWIRLKTGKDKMAESRGLPYLKERLRQRKQQ